MTAAETLDIAIIGTGAMGSVFGARLSQSARVALVDTWPEHVEAINRRGLRVEMPNGDVSVFTLTALTDADRLNTRVDAAIILTKSAATMAAAKTAQKLLKPDGFILTLQNGIGNLEVIQQVVGKRRAIAGVTAHGATLLGPGVVRHSGIGPTHIGQPDMAGPGFEALIDTFRRADFEIDLSPDIGSLIWGKLIINVGINALAAILRVPNGVLAEDEPARDILGAAVHEAVVVAKALGIALPYDNPFERVLYVCRLTGGNRASMLQDVLRGQATEIDVINGAIVRIGEALGIPTPHNRLLTNLVKAFENTRHARIQPQSKES